MTKIVDYIDQHRRRFVGAAAPAFAAAEGRFDRSCLDAN
jgi:hypothetical protein